MTTERINGRGRILSLPHLGRTHVHKPEPPFCVQDALKSSCQSNVAETIRKLQEGEMLLKISRSRWSGVRTQPVFFNLGDNLLHFRYRFVPCSMAPYLQKLQEKVVDLRDIRMVRFGLQETARSASSGGRDKKSRDFYGFAVFFENSFRKSLNVVTPDEHSAKTWVSALNYVRKRICSLSPRVQLELSLWEIFNSFTGDKDGRLCLTKPLRVLYQRGFVDDAAALKIKEKSKGKNLVSFAEFSSMYKSSHDPAEVLELFENVSPDKNSIRSRELYRFVQQTQGENDITEEDCNRLITEYEPDDSARAAGVMTLWGFSLYLASKYCQIFNWKHDEVYQNMGHPMSHYFIASSHNTYLTGDQLKDPSSTSAYVQALLKGCRCLELDCWDGPDDDPVIYHGYTLTSKISFKDVIECIGQYAFEASTYPLILSIENHCSVAQQKRMAYYLKAILGSELLTNSILPHCDESTLPSPTALKGKILLKGKKLADIAFSNAFCEDYDDVSVSQSDEDDAGLTSCNQTNPVNSNSDLVQSKEKLKLDKSLSDLVVYLKSVKFKMDKLSENLPKSENPRKFIEISSLTETKAMSMAKRKRCALVDYHKYQLGRTYPGGTRTDSSNYDPQPLWNAGFQMVAMNYQTKCEEMEHYLGKFRQNGNCGYVLKPISQRDDSSLSHHQQNPSMIKSKVQSLRLRVISAQYARRSVVRKAAVTEFASSGDSTTLHVELVVSGNHDDIMHRTSCLAGSSHLRWDKDFSMRVVEPEQAMVRFVLRDCDRGHERVGQNTLPFSSISQGYRFVPLLDRDGTKIQGTSLFVHVVVADVKPDRHPVTIHHNQIRVI